MIYPRVQRAARRLTDRELARLLRILRDGTNSESYRAVLDEAIIRRNSKVWR